MIPYGIYTMANDVVFDQLVALLNSIEVNVSAEIPICIIPYDDRLEKVKEEVASRPNLTLFDNDQEIKRWENFAEEVWAAHPESARKKIIKSKVRLQRKMVVFQGEFEKFVFYDADSLAMKPLTAVFEKLDAYDFVFDDWEPKKVKTALNLDKIEQSGYSTADCVRPKMHCSSFFGSRHGLFPEEELVQIQQRLIDHREVEWINGLAEAFLFTYLTMVAGYSMFNFTLSSDSQDRTGNCADADPFVNIDNVLYSQQGLKPIHRIHYMNYPSKSFAGLAQGIDADVPHKDVFLHYRFLKDPSLRVELQPSQGNSRLHNLNTFLSRVTKTLVRS
jgi:hypothetical protein